MPDFRQSGDKPLRPQDRLGTDVKIASQTKENDPWAQKMLKEIGQQFVNIDKQGDATYLGSFAVHIYKSKDMQTTNGQYGIAMVNQLPDPSAVNEYIIMTALSNLAVEIRKAYGRGHKTTDQNDKRGLAT